MNKNFNAFLILIFFLIGLGVSKCLFVVNEAQQAVVTQFGEPIGDSITKAGLYTKFPWRTVNYFDQRMLEWDGDPNQIPTRDKRYIWVDTTARWKIVDALKFMQSVGNQAGAQSRLDDIIDAATRDAISNSNLLEAIRSTNRLLEKKDSQADEIDSIINVTYEKVKKGRNDLSRSILENASQTVPNYGIELIDVRIKRINYVQDVRNKVYERMISERKRAAEQFRSEGQGKKAEIEGQMTKELKQIQSEAYRKAQEIKGTADAYNNEQEFYSFIKTLETYKGTISKDSILMLTTDSDFFKYLESIENPKSPF